MRVVVVGTGIAGLITAYRASADHEVVLVTKAELAESNTKYAQGGIAAALFPDDSAASHIEDTLRAGDGLCDPAAVEVLCTEGPQRVRDLIALGVEFDRAADGELARGHEAAHSHRRVIHAGGDATGLAIEVALLRAVRALAVEVHEHTFMRELVVEGVEPRVVGIEAIGPDGERFRIAADAVVLASGGAGQLYRHTTNPGVTTGDGIAAAFRAGAELADVEFYQFHPTALAVSGSPLVSEAVRGEGAVLLDEAGERFMFAVHPDGELAPRDVVARGIAAAMARQEGRPVLLDATALERAHGAGFLATRFPSITQVTRENGYDWAVEPVPVTPAAHYWMGGIRTDLHGRTSLPGLFAVGEAACTGVHGANRLASNSLLESLVFAWRAADALGAAAGDLDTPAARATRSAEWVPAARATRSTDGATQVVEERRAQPDASRDRRTAIQHLMWESVGLEREAVELRAALDRFEQWEAEFDTVTDLENRNLLDLARIVTRAALMREESRGAHDRTDYPETSPAWAFSQGWRPAAPATVTEPEPEEAVR
ncbi:L-aspartate oxidase [Protaetiibacter larvae]|uniref:L-aspartate oxidase n=1 Tax=Protaetiibacter larvae TaxID=2592654 RepID=A0A5C1Y844_9MICO|nr:L-aspartate oxidase [Protaetiibacter larvae]QEO10273.1 L-aspartate oxidase [Protaetiibacter larvae]